MTATSMRFEVHVWVGYSDEARGWTEENAENATDAIEQQIAQAMVTVKANQTHWIRLTYEGPSIVQTVQGAIIGGVAYVHEMVALNVTVRDPLVSRQTVREAIAAVLTQFVTSAAAVYAFQKKDLSVWPAVCVTSASSDRQALTG